jgi:hypothetical protein
MQKNYTINQIRAVKHKICGTAPIPINKMQKTSEAMNTYFSLLFQKVLQIKENNNFNKLEDDNIKKCGFHGSDYEECRLLGCYAVWPL